MKSLIFILFLIFTSSCHTTARWFDSDLDQTDPKSLKQLNSGDLDEIQPKVLSLQLQYGVFPPKKSLYSAEHNIHCYQDGALKACYLRLVLNKAPFLSQPLQLSRDLSLKLLKAFEYERFDLKKERQIFGSLICDHMNESLPPFEKKSVFCRAVEARKTNEFVIDELLSRQLTDILSKRESLAADSRKYEINCDAAVEHSCSIANTNQETDQVARSWIVLPGKIAKDLSKSFASAYLQHWSINSGKNKREVPKIDDLSGVLECSSLGKVIDSLYRCTILF